jgi:hypothetical protein
MYENILYPFPHEKILDPPQSGVVAQNPWTFLRLYFHKIIDNVDVFNSKFPNHKL